MDVLALYGLLVLTTLPPLVPNSALLVSAGVLAAHGDLFLPFVLIVVAGSATLGDLLMYLLARRFGGPARGWMRRSVRRRVLLEWTSRRIECYGLPFVLGVRFLPSGRIVGALASGVLRYPLRRYLLGTAIAETVWATYSIGLGYLGSAAVGNRLYAAAIGIGISCAVATLGALVPWLARRRAVRARRAPVRRVAPAGVVVRSGSSGGAARRSEGGAAQDGCRVPGPGRCSRSAVSGRPYL
ncbi:DedA family protein [Streptomyces catenulae]|uniref:VTT domain-containing protein n=1 Tax=Streptomyces catenulae TaxID=66875 RepID=A0ABV2YYG6_9ACTN|nr:VTT domain-containing protein [Streptomyces catenulae]